jgi:hypothetical protein
MFAPLLDIDLYKNNSKGRRLQISNASADYGYSTSENGTTLENTATNIESTDTHNCK